MPDDLLAYIPRNPDIGKARAEFERKMKTDYRSGFAAVRLMVERPRATSRISKERRKRSSTQHRQSE
jgi:hypothetical protein